LLNNKESLGTSIRVRFIYFLSLLLVVMETGFETNLLSGWSHDYLVGGHMIIPQSNSFLHSF